MTDLRVDADALLLLQHVYILPRGAGGACHDRAGASRRQRQKHIRNSRFANVE